jgi:hypothetical protein
MKSPEASSDNPRLAESGSAGVVGPEYGIGAARAQTHRRLAVHRHRSLGKAVRAGYAARATWPRRLREEHESTRGARPSMPPPAAVSTAPHWAPRTGSLRRPTRPFRGPRGNVRRVRRSVTEFSDTQRPDATTE